MRPTRERTVRFGGSDTQVVLFNPKTFDEAGDLVGHLQRGRSVVTTLEGQPTENARRLLDFISGITFALDGKVTPVAAKTYFITPQNVDFVAPQAETPESEEKSF
ncbi:MAG: cell division protein SepF [Oscillospiraceae bacterium]|nr:cell division protein SepF [Oscillospiraceae bacterium]